MPFCISPAALLQILRGLKRLILGLGELPSPPRQLECAPANKTTLRLSWAAPQAAGHPAFHKYVLSRQRVTPGTGSSRAAAASPLGGSCAADGAEERWEEVATPDDEDSMWFDAPPAKGSYRYRLTAWSAYGHSAHAHTPVACAVRAVQRQPPPPLAPAEVEAILSAAAAASNLSVGQAGAAAGAAWTWSAASSAVVVGLTILLKASQLRVGAKLAALWRAGVAAVAGTAGVAAPPGEQQQQEGGPLATGSSGMRRVGSSHASLAGLAGEAGGSAEAHMLPLPSGASTLLHSHSSSQLLFAGGSGVQGEGPGCDDTAAGEAGLLEEDALEDADAERLAQAIQRGHHCGHPGCHRRFDRLRDMRRKLEVSCRARLL